MSRGSELNPDHDYDEEWCCQVELGYMMSSLYMQSYVMLWRLQPGSPARPAEEQEYLRHMKQQLFSMLADYTFTHIE
ncbi:MAG: hypothetical protein CM15mV3_0910 [Caudoviricetes sp.]|nr:MAG: hypothetical protein CM15mV3_0910 [Caudoviricetes sp.]